MVWKLGQRSLYCPEHLSFHSLGRKTDFSCGRSLRQTKKEISRTFGRAGLFSGFLPFLFRNLIKIQTREIHLIAHMNHLYLGALNNSNILSKKKITNVTLKGNDNSDRCQFPQQLPILLRASFFSPTAQIPQQGGSLQSTITHVAPAWRTKTLKQRFTGWRDKMEHPDLTAAGEVDMSEWHSSTAWTMHLALKQHKFHQSSVLLPHPGGAAWVEDDKWWT